MARDPRLLFHAKKLLMRAIRPELGQGEWDRHGSAPCSHLGDGRHGSDERVRCSSLFDWPVYPRLRLVRSGTRSNSLREAGARTGPRLSDGLSTGLQRLLAGICSVRLPLAFAATPRPL